MSPEQQSALDDLLKAIGDVEQAVKNGLWGRDKSETLNRMDRAYGVFSRACGR